MGEILFLTHRVPWPPDRGDKIRSFHILRKLQDLAPVHLACFADEPGDPDKPNGLAHTILSEKIVHRAKPTWRAGIESLLSGRPISLASFSSGAISRYISELIRCRDISCIYVFSGQMAQFIPKGFDGRVIMDFADVDSAKFESYASDGSGPMAWINRREGQLLKLWEQRIAEQTDYSLFVSEAEASLFRRRTGLAFDKIRALGNGIDLDFYNPNAGSAAERPEGEKLIIFTGQMDYHPNIEAVTSFAKLGMPEIIARHHEARFAIVGRAPPMKVRRLAEINGTVVTGAVDDIRDWFKSADIVVAPLRTARGIQNKVLEAMAMARPVVASSAAAEGIEASDGEHFLIARDPRHEAELVSHLLSNPNEARLLGERAAELMKDKYSWAQQLSNLAEICGFEEAAVLEAAE